MELLLTGRVLSAEEAQAIGLIHRIVPAGEDVLAEAVLWAQELGRLPAGAMAAMKTLVQAAGQRPLPETAQLESRLFTSLWSADDHQEAIQAFLEKREPEFNQD
jgi:enoyl-CoA hydratase/carnithine racemase